MYMFRCYRYFVISYKTCQGYYKIQ